MNRWGQLFQSWIKTIIVYQLRQSFRSVSHFKAIVDQKWFQKSITNCVQKTCSWVDNWDCSNYMGFANQNSWLESQWVDSWTTISTGLVGKWLTEMFSKCFSFADLEKPSRITAKIVMLTKDLKIKVKHVSK